MKRATRTGLCAALLSVCAAGALAGAVLRAQGVPDGPEPLAWDKAACAHCRMLVGDPRYAGEIITRDGDVLPFDDPGCLLTYLATRHPQVHRVWFRDSVGDGWIAADRAGFVTVAGAATPMGYGLRAVAAGSDGARSLAEAEALVARGPTGHRPAAGDLP
jgi:hypothetical protein